MSAEEVHQWRDQLLLTLVAVATVLLVLPVLALSGGLSLVAFPAIAVAVALVASRRDTSSALLALVIVAGLWFASDPDATTPWSLVLAVLMLITHSALALRSSLPPSTAISLELIRRWLRRVGLVVVLTGLVYLASIAVHHLHRSDNAVVVALALGVLGGLVLLLRKETLHQDGP